MTLPMVTCPLCCRPGFSSSDSLFTALVDVTNRQLTCPICNHEVLGLDKFTIHLFSHSLSRYGNLKQPKDSTFETNNKKCFENVRYNLSIDPEQIYGGGKCQSNTNEELINKSVDNKDSSLSKNVPVKYTTKNNDPSLIYFRPDNGQIFAITHENLGTNLKNVTINTQNYITSTNITTSTLQTNLIGNVQKRKYCQMQENNINNNNNNKGIDVEGSPEIMTNGETMNSWPSTPSLTSDIDKITNNNSNEREFESCKELLTKGDFSTNVDEMSDTEIVDNNNKTNELENKTKGNICELCSYIFPNKAILAMHVQLIHKKVETEIESKRKLLFCNQCPRTFNLRSSLMIHRRVAHAGGFGNNDNPTTSKECSSNLTCHVCGKYFTKEIHLSQHMKVHDEKQWQCSICAKGFTTKYFLKKHRRLHTGEMPYRCKTCSKSFTFQQTYRKHLLYHNNDKPYCCTQCGRSFKELSTLHNHERIHSGEKPFTCETCGKAFRQRVSYLVHRRIHTGAMPYKCTACNKSFRYKISQRTHKCTAQPPGVVIRAQGYLVHKLQAAMNKMAGGKTEESKIVQETSSINPKICQNVGNSSDSNKSLPTLSMTEKNSTSSTTIQNNHNKDNKLVKTLTEVPKLKLDKPQIYLLVKGPNGETYYQPLIFSQNIVTPVIPSNSSENKNYIIPAECPKFTETILHSNVNVQTKSTIESSSNLFDNKQSPKITNVINIDEKDTSKSTEKEGDKEADKLCSKEKEVFSGQHINTSVSTEFANATSIMSDLFDTLIVVNNDSQNNTKINNIVSESNSDTAIDSADLFSLMLSPPLSSPSDKFGQLSLSPHTTLQPEEVQQSQDSFFENITDDTLKELLFGGDK